MKNLKKVVTVALSALLMGCSMNTPINEEKLCGATWKAWVWDNIYDMYVAFNNDHTYKMVIGSHGEYSNLTGWRHPHYYYEGTWSTDEDDIFLMCGDTIAHTLYDVDIKKKEMTFDFYDGYKKDGNERCSASKANVLKQSAITGTWSFTERNVLGFTYNMIITFHQDYYARMTYGSIYEGEIEDHKNMPYTIVGPYIIFKGITPLNYMKYQSISNGKMKFISGNYRKELKEFYFVPQDPTAHKLRLDGFIF